MSIQKNLTLFQTLDFLSNQLQQKNFNVLKKHQEKGGPRFVFFVDDKSDTSKKYSIKASSIFNISTSDIDQDKLNICQQETQMIRECKHKNVVDIHSDFQLGFYHFIQMNQCISSLQDFIDSNQSKINDSLFLHYANQIIDGVEYLHNKGYVVGNCLVESIMVTNDGIIKFYCFGFPNKFDDNFKKKDFYSKNEIEFLNIPPEIMENINNNNKEQVKQTQKADIWSLGVCLSMLGGSNMCDFNQMEYPYFQKQEIEQKSNKINKLVNYILNTNPLQRPNIQEIRQKINLLFFKNMFDEQILLNKQINNNEQQNNDITIERLIDFDSNKVDIIYYKYIQYEKLYPKNINTLITLGYIEVKYHSQFSEAKRYFEKCIELNCNEIDAYLGLCLIIILDRQYKYYNKAYDYLEGCLKIKKDYWRIYYIKTWLLFLSNKDKEGLEILEIGLKLDCDSVQLLSLKICYFDDYIGDNKKAQQLIQKVINQNTENDPFIYLRIAEFFTFNKNQKDIMLAIHYCLQAYKYNSRDLRMLIILTENYKNNENFKESKKYIDRAQLLYPKHSSLLYFLAIIEEDENKKLKLLEESIQSDDENRHSYFQIGKIYEEQQKYDEAIIQYQKILIFKPDDIQTLLYIGDVLCFKQLQYSKALYFYKRIIKMNSFNLTYLNQIGCAYKNLYNYEKAIFYFKKCLDLDPNYEYAQYNLTACKSEI